MTLKHINCNCSLFGFSPGLTTHCSFFTEDSLAIIILNRLQFYCRSAQEVTGCLFEVGRLKVLSGGGVAVVGAYSRLGACQLFQPSGWVLTRGEHLFEVGRLIK